MSASPRPPHVDQSYPLSTLFLLTAACASVLGLITPLVRGRVGEDIGLDEFAGVVIASGIALGGVGALVGLFHYHRLIASLLGFMLGIMLGALSGPLAFVPSRDFSYVLVSALGGGVILLGLAAALRLGSGGWRKGDLLTPRQHPRNPQPHALDPDPEEGKHSAS